MNQNKPPLRFDHREIFVIFSLFVFVSLLMFTVGILVGKGLAQYKYEAGLLPGDRRSPASAPVTENASAAPAVPTAPSPVENAKQAPPAAAAKPDAAPADSETDADEEPTNPASQPATVADEKNAQSEGLPDSPSPDAKPTQDQANQPLKLIPEHPKDELAGENSLQEPKADGGSEDLLKNPHIRALLEERNAAAAARKSKTAAVVRVPASFNQGKFTVQVGSYPTKEDADQRVAQLKKLGFPYAYFSAKQLGDKKETWFRVWLGYYPDLPSAEKSGRTLQERGEVKNYIVRKTDNAG